MSHRCNIDSFLPRLCREDPLPQYQLLCHYHHHHLNALYFCGVPYCNACSLQCRHSIMLGLFPLVSTSKMSAGWSAQPHKEHTWMSHARVTLNCSWTHLKLLTTLVKSSYTTILLQSHKARGPHHTAHTIVTWSIISQITWYRPYHRYVYPLQV